MKEYQRCSRKVLGFGDCEVVGTQFCEYAARGKCTSQTFCLGEIRWKLNLQHSDHMPDALHGQL